MARPPTRQPAPSRRMTADEFSQLDPDLRAELVRGRVVPLAVPKPRHGVISVRIAARLLGFVEANKLGFVTNECGFVVARDPDTVRSPDVAFVSFERLGSQELPEKWPSFAPDLAVEVISPSERPKQIREKVQDWFAGGARRVWLFYPRTCNVYVLRSPTDVQILGPGDTLTGEDLLPGFSCPVAALFEPPGR